MRLRRLQYCEPSKQQRGFQRVGGYEECLFWFLFLKLNSVFLVVDKRVLDEFFLRFDTHHLDHLALRFLQSEPTVLLVLCGILFELAKVQSGEFRLGLHHCCAMFELEQRTLTT